MTKPKPDFDKARPVGPDGRYTAPYVMNCVPIMTHPDGPTQAEITEQDGRADAAMENFRNRRRPK